MPDPLVNRELETEDQQVRDQAAFLDALFAKAEQVVFGQRPFLEGIIIGLLCGGHVLIEGAPGLAKTLTAKTIAQLLQLDFQRIQFTPDLLPADLTGTPIYHPPSGEFRTRKGPIFTHLLLADEINRAPAKVQSALLEAMEERQVTLGNECHRLADPFCVLATQNPLEHEGTYPLPEAQLDRFLLKILVDYPERSAEERMLDGIAAEEEPALSPLVNAANLAAARQAVRNIYLSAELRHYLLDLVAATRAPKQVGRSDLERYIAHGISPRGTLHLAHAARARAFMQQRSYVVPDDIQELLGPVLRHRLILSYEAEVDALNADQLLVELLAATPSP